MLRRRQLSHGVLTDVPRMNPTSSDALVLKNYALTPGTTLVRRVVKEQVGISCQKRCRMAIGT
jgi:hypothetical protein